MVRSSLATALLGVTLGLSVTPALALTAKECSTKYQAAKQAGTLNGQKWNDFRKAECGAEAARPRPPRPCRTRWPPPAAPRPPPPAPAPAPGPRRDGTAAFPAKVDPKYASESAGKQRMHTCLDSYNAAKAAGTLGDMKWIQKGGGYYSACNKRLKG